MDVPAQALGEVLLVGRALKAWAAAAAAAGFIMKLVFLCSIKQSLLSVQVRRTLRRFYFDEKKGTLTPLRPRENAITPLCKKGVPKSRLKAYYC